MALYTTGTTSNDSKVFPHDPGKSLEEQEECGWFFYITCSYGYKENTIAVFFARTIGAKN
jgi:hypothetical protein